MEPGWMGNNGSIPQFQVDGFGQNFGQNIDPNGFGAWGNAQGGSILDNTGNSPLGGFTTQIGDSGGFGGNQPGGGFMDGLLGNNQRMGWGQFGLGAAGALYKGWLGKQQLDMAKDNLAFKKDAFNRNFNEQKRLVERRYNDRARAAAIANA